MRRPLALQALATPKLLGNEDRRVTTDFGRLTSSIPSPSAPVGGPRSQRTHREEYNSEVICDERSGERLACAGCS